MLRKQNAAYLLTSHWSQLNCSRHSPGKLLSVDPNFLFVKEKDFGGRKCSTIVRGHQTQDYYSTCGGERTVVVHDFV